MRLKVNVLSVAVFVILVAGAPATGGTARWTVDDVLLAESASDFDVSPDGRKVVWVKTRMSKEKGEEIASLFLTELSTGREIQLTRGTDVSGDPRWSPDGTRIAFLTDRPLPGATDGEQEEGEKPEDRGEQEKNQIWMMSAMGGEPWPLTRLERGVTAFEWRSAGEIALLAKESPSLYELEREEDTSRVVEDERHEPPVRLFRVNAEDGSVKRVSRNGDWMEALSVSPDGRWAATIHERSLRFEYDNDVPPVVNLTDLETGEARPVAHERRLCPREITWALDGKGFYLTADYSSDPRYFTATIRLVHYYDLASDRLIDVDLDWPNGLAAPSIQPTADGFIALVADGTLNRASRYVKDGDAWQKSPLEAEHAGHLFDWSLGRDGKTLVYRRSTASEPPQWYAATLGGNAVASPRAFTKLNADWESKPIPRSEIVRFKGARDEEVEGVLHYPIDYEPGRRYPLVLLIHGGPNGVDKDEWELDWSDPITLLTQREAFVFEPNYHGSSDYGLTWVESICCGSYYDLEPVDIENGVDFLIERGLVDPERLGVMGWSNGAILTTALTTRSRRFKAASAGAGDVEWISDWANVDFGAAFDNYYFGKAPYQDPELYVRKSPYFRLDEVTTPTILFTGTEDRNVPPSQSWSHYRVLQQATDTPVKLVLFPGEPHGLQKYVHQRRKMEEELAWLDRYVFGRPEKNASLKEGSPLDVLLRAHEAWKVDGRYGVEVGGRLVPEVVTYQGIEVGRFELTRAQFAAFDAGYTAPAGTEDYPMNGISFEQATRYTEWLSKLTGERYRLPDPEEAESLYGPNPTEENTLDYWAGYPPNPEDAEALSRAVAGLPGEAPLLRPVGRFPGRGEEVLVFDVGGNVSEWCLSAEGEGTLCGGSADQPADAMSRGGLAAPPYRGMRVVREKKP